MRTKREMIGDLQEFVNIFEGLKDYPELVWIPGFMRLAEHAAAICEAYNIQPEHEEVEA